MVMTSAQRRSFKREVGVTVPSNVPCRYTVTDNEHCLEVFFLEGQSPWVPFGAARTEPGEVDRKGHAAVRYFFPREVRSNEDNRPA